GLRRDGDRHARAVGSHLLARAAHDPLLRRQPAVAAGGGLRAHRRRPHPHAAVPGHARARPGVQPSGRHRAHDARQPARHAGRRLRPHRTIQGVAEPARGAAPCAPQRHDAGAHRDRPLHRHASGRGGGHRDRLQHPRRRPPGDRVGPTARLPGPARFRHRRRAGVRGGQLAGRPQLPGAGPARAVRMTVAAPARRGGLRRWKVLRRPTVAFGTAILGAIVLAAAFAPVISPYDPNALAILDRLQPPSVTHPMGTDDLGRDVWSRVLHGARLSLIVGFATAVIAAGLGTLVSLVAGYYRWLDEIVMRVMDGLMALPGVVLAIAIMAAIGPKVSNIVLALSLVYLPRCARVARSAVIVVREQVYVEAASALGAGDRSIMLKHILPGTVSPVLVQATYVFATAVLLEASL